MRKCASTCSAVTLKRLHMLTALYMQICKGSSVSLVTQLLRHLLMHMTHSQLHQPTHSHTMMTVQPPGLSVILRSSMAFHSGTGRETECCTAHLAAQHQPEEPLRRCSLLQVSSHGMFMPVHSQGQGC